MHSKSREYTGYVIEIIHNKMHIIHNKHNKEDVTIANNRGIKFIKDNNIEVVNK
jgi:hypothetical protein